MQARHPSDSYVIVRLHHEVLTVVISPERSGIDEHRQDGAALSTVDQILQRDDAKLLRLDHVENLILHVVHGRHVDLLRLQKPEDGAEEVVDHETIQTPLMLNVYELPKILDCLLRVLVLHCQDKIQERFVVHFTLAGFSIAVCLVLLKNTINEHVRQHATAKMAQFILAQHPILVHVKLQVGAVDPQSGLHTEPVGFGF
mmetsp:Transcript_76399/g.216015  ORF Transcript_76399/g.216015 Transcript_76399/m.216015 type:complete len:200 (-) Transcript_76399:903-1502(-)